MSNAIATLLCYFASTAYAELAVHFGVVVNIGPARGSVSRWNCKGACKRCNAKTSLLGALHTGRDSISRCLVEVVVTSDGRGFRYENGRVAVPCRGCGVTRFAARIAGKVDMSKTCNAKCESACGPSCECSCGGKNHGASVSL